jgi:hypothetical protein
MMLVTLAVSSGCSAKGAESEVETDAEIDVACRLDALSLPDRAREAVLLQEHFAQLRETREERGGFVFRYAPTPTLAVHLAEMVSLEHRCCPFLRFELTWPQSNTDAGPQLRIAGDAKVKELIVGAFTKKAG